jgi:diadenosine tetraphosphatase ApaH/serine/threonine PP2A family protein phosphatase
MPSPHGQHRSCSCSRSWQTCTQSRTQTPLLLPSAHSFPNAHWQHLAHWSPFNSSYGQLLAQHLTRWSLRLCLLQLAQYTLLRLATAMVATVSTNLVALQVVLRCT